MIWDRGTWAAEVKESMQRLPKATEGNSTAKSWRLMGSRGRDPKVVSSNAKSSLHQDIDAAKRGPAVSQRTMAGLRGVRRHCLKIARAGRRPEVRRHSCLPPDNERRRRAF